MIWPAARPGAERWRLLAGDRVAVGEDDLAGDAIGVHRLVADVGVEGAPKSLGVLALPLRHVLAVDLLDQPAVVVALDHPLVELRMELRSRGTARYSSTCNPAWVSDDTMT